MSLRYAHIAPDNQKSDAVLPNEYWWPINLNQFLSDNGINISDQTDEWLAENLIFKINNGSLPTKNEDGNNEIKLSKYIHWDETQGYHTKWIINEADMDCDLPMTDEEIQIANEFKE